MRNYWWCVSVIFIIPSSDIATARFEWNIDKKVIRKSRRVVSDQNVVRCLKLQRVMVPGVSSLTSNEQRDLCLYVLRRKHVRRRNKTMLELTFGEVALMGKRAPERFYR